MKTRSTLFIVLILLSSRLLAQTAQVENGSEFLTALGNGTIDRIELLNDITVASAITIDRTLTISGGASDQFSLIFTSGEVMVRNHMTPIVVTLEDLKIVMHDPDEQRPYGIKHMTGELIAENIAIDLKCGDGGYQPGLAPAGIYVHVGTTSTINASLIEVDNDYTGATYGAYFTAQGNHTVTNTEFNLSSLGTYRFPFGTQNVTGPPAGPFALADFPAMFLTGNTASGATHCMMVYLLDGDVTAQMDDAKAIIDYVIANNGGVTKAEALPPVGQIRDGGGIITDYPLPPVPVPFAAWVVYSVIGLVLVFGLIRIRMI